MFEGSARGAPASRRRSPRCQLIFFIPSRILPSIAVAAPDPSMHSNLIPHGFLQLYSDKVVEWSREALQSRERSDQERAGSVGSLIDLAHQLREFVEMQGLRAVAKRLLGLRMNFDNQPVRPDRMSRKSKGNHQVSFARRM